MPRFSAKRSTPTVAQVAEMANVSTATVSRAITGSAPVSPQTKRKVRRVMEELGYQPNMAARALRSQRSGNIGVILPGFDNQFFFELLPHIEESCRKRGYTVLIAGGDDPAEECRRLSLTQAVDGIILVTSSWEHENSPELEGVTVPVITFDRPMKGVESLVYVDNFQGAVAVTQHLIGQGAASLMHIEGPAATGVSKERKEGFLAACEASQIDKVVVVKGDFTAESGASAVESFESDLPDAIFAANDLMAIGALQACQKAGIDVPGEMLVAGFDGITTSTMVFPSLTTLVQPVAKMADVAVRNLSLLIEGEDLPHSTTRLSGTLRIGGSTMR